MEKRDEYVSKIPADSNIKEIMSKSEAIITSSLMALCGMIKPERRTNWIKRSRSEYEEEYEEFCDLDDQESLEERLVRYSNINAVVAEINRIARNSASYLLDAPLKTIKGKLDSVIEILHSEIAECEAKVASYNANLELSKKEIEEVENYLIKVSEQIKIYPLENKLQLRISDAFTDLCSLRSKKASGEFSSDNYPEPGAFTSGVRKQNLARYNLFVSNFEDIIRNQLGTSCENGSYGLIGAFRSIINEYVGNITELLVTSKISEDNRKLFKHGLLKELQGKLSTLQIIVNSNAIEEAPKGQQLQWSLFKTKFEGTFDDEYFNNSLDQFRQCANSTDGLSDPSISIYKIQKLRDELVNMMSLAPEQKEEAKKKELETIAKLNKELKVYTDMLKKIIALLKSSKTC